MVNICDNLFLKTSRGSKVMEWTSFVMDNDNSSKNHIHIRIYMYLQYIKYIKMYMGDKTRTVSQLTKGHPHPTLLN